MYATLIRSRVSHTFQTIRQNGMQLDGYSGRTIRPQILTLEVRHITHVSSWYANMFMFLFITMCAFVRLNCKQNSIYVHIIIHILTYVNIIQ